MSRLGKIPVALPKGCKIRLEGDTIIAEGPKGNLKLKILPGITIDVGEESVLIKAKEEKRMKPFHGLYRALVANLLTGVSVGFEKKLQLIGVGYRAALKGQVLDVQVGFSHPSTFSVPEGIEVKVENSTSIVIKGMDKQLVGQFAANVRALRPPEPYKGKGIHYEGEYVRRKAGKAAKGK